MPFSPVSRRGEVTADHVRELQRYCGDWAAWTPTVTQSGAVTVTVTYARYCLVGKVCHVQARLAVTGSGTETNAIVIGGQPAAIQPRYSGASVYVLGTAYVLF